MELIEESRRKKNSGCVTFVITVICSDHLFELHLMLNFSKPLMRLYVGYTFSPLNNVKLIFLVLFGGLLELELEC